MTPSALRVPQTASAAAAATYGPPRIRPLLLLPRRPRMQRPRRPDVASIVAGRRLGTSVAAASPPDCWRASNGGGRASDQSGKLADFPHRTFAICMPGRCCDSCWCTPEVACREGRDGTDELPSRLARRAAGAARWLCSAGRDGDKHVSAPRVCNLHVAARGQGGRCWLARRTRRASFCAAHTLVPARERLPTSADHDCAAQCQTQGGRDRSLAKSARWLNPGSAWHASAPLVCMFLAAARMHHAGRPAPLAG